MRFAVESLRWSLARWALFQASRRWTKCVALSHRRGWRANGWLRISSRCASGICQRDELLPRRCLEQPGIRRLGLMRFPYLLYYRWEADREFVTIFAVMHCSREPGYWKQRIG